MQISKTEVGILIKRGRYQGGEDVSPFDLVEAYRAEWKILTKHNLDLLAEVEELKKELNRLKLASSQELRSLKLSELREALEAGDHDLIAATLTPQQMTVYRATGEIERVTSQTISAYLGITIPVASNNLAEVAHIGLLRRSRDRIEFVYSRTGVKL